MGLLYTQAVFFGNWRVCRKCQHSLPDEDFRRDRHGYLQSACRRCESAAALRRYYETREAALPRMAAWRKANPDKVKANRRKWLDRSVEHRKKMFAAYRTQHRDRLSAKRRMWYRSNRAHAQTYRREHPGDRLRHRHTYRARKRANGGTFTQQEWQALCVKYQHRCLCCGKSEPEIKLTADHVIPLSLGGRNDITNLQPLCHSCNSSKNAKHIDYRPLWEV